MLTRAVAFYTNKMKDKVDWRLLTFLLLFLNVKLAVKIPVIILFSLWQFNFKFGFRFKDSRLPLFYPLIIIIALVNWIIYKGYVNGNYNILLFTGIGFWLLCILAIHQVKLAVDNNSPEIVHQTISAFFIVNTLISVLTLVVIVLKTHSINPYTYQGEYQKYFINTGDYIKGITFDTSITNATLNAFGVVYFLIRKNAVMLLVCMATLLLTGSNFINLALLPILLLLFAFKTNRYQKSLVVVCLIFLIVFMAKISPQNNKYATLTLVHLFQKHIPVNTDAKHKNTSANLRITDRPDNTLTPEEHKQKIATLYLDSVGKILDSIRASKRPKYAKNVYLAEGGRIAITEDDINGDYYQSKKETPVEQLQLLDFIREHKATLPISGNNNYTAALPGKAMGFLQTTALFHGHLGKALMGAGMGNFSSKIAYRAAGFGFAGGYPSRDIYINHDFLVNHLDLYLSFFSKRSGYHSLTNSPFSVYDQLLAEYGMIGLALFMIFYVGFFAKHYQKLTYSLPILFLMLAVLFTDYWFEQLSVMVFFELLLLLNIKENQTVKSAEHEF
ncbi:hypothetical protein SAMN05428975_3656 [Mucilaginibacter sp. OK268]|uniref:hypothetical protein n=1 Tax=Mucilaginibacter sp. OK268 TaxID=1881048 RepID=UPI00088D58D0|nr:hypothetical protein [Mucilaginibacter sp. OK268]SDP92256.1 hypothetical protein SAMN05428975_3656 [Mucilaginibacter sp. OK268]